MYRRILVPLDGSSFAEAALPAAVSLAEKAKSALRLLCVHNPIPNYESAIPNVDDDGRWARAYLSDVEKSLRKTTSLSISTGIRRGPVAREIMTEAEWSSDLIVMSSHGRGAFSRFWLGGVTDECIRRSHRPVLVIRPPDDNADPEPAFTVGSVTVPLDGSELAEVVLPRAVHLAQLFHAPIKLVQSIAYPVGLGSSYFPMTEWVPSETETREEAAKAYLAGVAERLEQSGVTTTVHLVRDVHPAQAILDHSGNAGMVVIATHGRGGLGRALIGSIADKVIRGAQAPVLVVRSEGKEAAQVPRDAMEAASGLSGS